MCFDFDQRFILIFFCIFFIIDFIWPWFGSVCITHFDLFAFTIKCYRFFYLYFIFFIVIFLFVVSLRAVLRCIVHYRLISSAEIPFTSNLWRRCVCTQFMHKNGIVRNGIGTEAKTNLKSPCFFFFRSIAYAEWFCKIAGPISIR